MTLTCPKCQQRYDLETLRLKGKDRTASCGKCGHRFVVRLLKAPTRAPAPPDMTMVARPTGASVLPALHVRVALTVLDGPEKDRVFRITMPLTVLGRTEGDIRLPDPRVSSRHAQIEVEGGEVWLHDLGSRNGTFVNGERADRVRLSHMDEVTVGGTHLLYTYMQDLASAIEDLVPTT